MSDTLRVAGLTAEQVHAWWQRPATWERLGSPWSPAEVPSPPGALRVDADDQDLVLTLPEAMSKGPQAHPSWRAFRARRIGDDLARLAELADHPSKRVAITGATGLVGSALASMLGSFGHDVLTFSRSRGGPKTVLWDPDQGPPEGSLDTVDAVVHLAGEPISGPRWTPERKRLLRQSRVGPTSALAHAIVRTGRPIDLVSASAVGWWGHQDHDIDDRAPAGTGFLAETALAWEAAAEPARIAGLRVVHPRIGIVVAGRGGMLSAILPSARLGLGGPIAGGQQGVPWVALDDLAAMLAHAAIRPTWSGPFAAVSPSPVTQAVFAKTLGDVLGRPAWLPAPGIAVRAALGEQGQALVIEGAQIRPSTLQALGFRWAFPELEDALRFELGKLPAR